MKIILSGLMFLITSGLIAQSENEKSDLRIRIDSIIEFQIGYKADPTTNKHPARKWDSTKQRGLYPSFSSMPPNPMTLILLDKQIIELHELNDYELSKVEIIKVYNMNDQIATTIYGTGAKNGLIILESKK